MSRMHRLFPRMPQPRSPGSSCGLGQGHVRRAGLWLQWWYRRPGFRPKAPSRQRLLTQQRHQQDHPALAKHAHQAPAGRPPPPRASWAQGCHVEQRAGRHRLVGRPTHPEQPQGCHRHRQPQPCGACRMAHARAVPWPPRTCGDLQARLDPGAEPLPARITGRRRQVGQDQPRVLVAFFPADQHGADDLLARQGQAVPRQLAPGRGAKVRNGRQLAAPAGRKLPPVLMRNTAASPGGEASKQPRRIPAAIAQDDTVQPGESPGAAAATAATIRAARRVWHTPARPPRPPGWRSRDTPR